MIWGGSGDQVTEKDGSAHSELLTDGAAYNPATNSWRKLPKSPLAGRYGQASFWTGSEMLVVDGLTFSSDGSGQSPKVSQAGAFDPATGKWRTFSWEIGNRQGHSVTLTGTNLIVWGGQIRTSDDPAANYVNVADGFVIDPEDGTSQPLPKAPLEARSGHAAAWLGQQLIIWGGYSEGAVHFADGATYKP